MALPEVDSKDFYPPTLCHFEELTGKDLKDQQSDRNRIVCASGIDMHIQRNTLNKVDSAGRKILDNFSPRHSSGACPSSYTGKSLTREEEEELRTEQDCIQRSKVLHEKKPYHPKLYEKFDPRLRSKTVVLRDYVCKVPLDVTNMTDVANAVLNEYPDHYVQFLTLFVDNMFGESMKRFLQSSWEKYEAMKRDKQEINKLSWSFYSAVHKASSYSDGGEVTGTLPDYTLHWDADVMRQIIKINDAGVSNTEINTASDLIDLMPCLDHHIAVLKEMHASCKSFATSETSARLMLEYANMQGRNLCDDFMLLDGSETPEYKNVTLKVPVSLFSELEVTQNKLDNVSLDSTIYKDVEGRDESVVQTNLMDLPVGYFAGQIFNSGLRVGSQYDAQYRWGWGHPCNIFQNVETVEDGEYNVMPSFMPMSISIENDDVNQSVSIDLDKSNVTAGYMKKWVENWRKRKLTKQVNKKSSLTLDSLLARSERGVDSNYRHVPVMDSDTDYALDSEQSRHSLVKTTQKVSHVPCSSGINILNANIKFHSLTHPILLADKCIEYDGQKVYIPPSFLVPPTIFTESTRYKVFDGVETQISRPIISLLSMLNRNADLHSLLGESSKYENSEFKVDGGLPDYNYSYRNTISSDSYDKLISEVTRAPKLVKELKDTLNGKARFDRNIALFPGLPYRVRNLVSSKKSWRSRGVYKLSDPKSLKPGVSMDSSLNTLSEKDRYICKISFLRYLLQYSVGMNTAALIFEEIMTDEETIVLNWLDVIRNGELEEDESSDTPWLRIFMDLDLSGDTRLEEVELDTLASVINGTPHTDSININALQVYKILKNFGLDTYYISSSNGRIETVDDMISEMKTLKDISMRSEQHEDIEDGKVLKVLMKRLLKRYKALLSSIDKTDCYYESELPSDVNKNFGNVFPSLHARTQLFDKFKKQFDVSNSKIIDDGSVGENELVTAFVATHYESIGRKPTKDSEYLARFVARSTRGKDIAAIEASIDTDDLVLIVPSTPEERHSTSIESSDKVKHFGSRTEVLKSFMENETDSFLTSSDTLAYLMSQNPVRDTGLSEGTYSYETDSLRHRYNTTNAESRITSFTNGLTEEFSDALGDIFSDSVVAIDTDIVGLFYEETCCQNQVFVNALTSLQHSYESHMKNRKTESDTWDAYRTKSSNLESGKYTRPQIELDYFRDLDVRCKYTSTLASFKSQVQKMSNRDDVYAYNKEMGESKVIEHALKELIDTKVFTSQYHKIIQTMFSNEEFVYTSKVLSSRNYTERSEGPFTREKVFRSTESGAKWDNFTVSYQTSTTDSTMTAHMPFKKNTNMKGLSKEDKEDLVSANEAIFDDLRLKRFTFFPADDTPSLDQWLYKLYYNDVRCKKGSMLFSMLDAAGFAWANRKYSSPGENNRPQQFEKGNQDRMHYWSRTLVESFVNSREVYTSSSEASTPWEVAVRLFPDKVFKSSLIGGMCNRTWSELFPLLSKHHPLRAKLERVRSLNVMWYELKGYKVTPKNSPEQPFATSDRGAWIPLPVSHQVHLMKRVGLYDEENQMPVNPWNERDNGSSGLLKVFNQSYHSPWPMTRSSGYFKDWIKSACKYQTSESTSFHPFTQYGGHPVEADFVHHVVERPVDDKYVRKRHAEMVYDRYGNIDPIRMGNVFEDTGLLQNMFSFKYSDTSKVEKNQRDALTQQVRVSNFLAYARVHTIMALGSCNPGTTEISHTLAARNFFRLHVDTYKCAGKQKDSDGVPVVLGYIGLNPKKESDPSILFIAGTMNCLNSLMAQFCNGPLNKGEKVVQMYKQMYFNNATLLFEKLLRQERTRFRHKKNFARVLEKDPTKTQEQFDKYLLDLKEEHITFLQHLVISMLQRNGLTDKELPLGILEPRDFYVDPHEAQEGNLVGADYLSPKLLEDAEEMDFGTEEMDYQQLSILSLVAPEVGVAGMYRLAHVPEEFDGEFLKSQVTQKVSKDNKNVWKDVAKRAVKAALGAQYLEYNPVDLAFDPEQFKNPSDEYDKIGLKKSTSMKLRDTESSLRVRSDDLRKSKSSNSASSRLLAEHEKSLNDLDNEIQQESKVKGTTPLTELAGRSDIPDSMKRKLAKMYI